MSITPVSNVNSSTNTLVNFYLVGSNVPSVVAALLGDSTYGPIQGSGGWQIVDRPKTIAATQWYDRSPFQLTMTLLLDDSFSTVSSGGVTINTESMCQILESWLDVMPNSSNYQPETFTLTGPVPGVAVSTSQLREWFIFSMSFTNAIRDNSTGNRIQQQVDITLYEYQTPIPGGNSTATATSSPSAKVAKALTTANVTGVNPFAGAYTTATSPSGTLTTPVTAATTSSTSNTIPSTPSTNSTVSGAGVKLYTIKKGDTLQMIASRQKKNNSTYIAAIKRLNGIRDDSALAHMVGKVIKLPAS